MLVVREYRRFLVLTQVAGVQVCPSDDVDQAWHLHITRTADYERFCREVFGRFLHHHPAAAGTDEHRRHRAMYAATLSHYRRAFSAEAPPDAWPAVDRRFDAAPPREAATIRLRGVFASGLFVAIMGALGILALALALNLLGALDATHEMSGPHFLHIAVPLTIALLVLGFLSTSPFARIEARDTLDAYEAAWLIGAEGRMTATALGLLVERGCLALRSVDIGIGRQRRSVTQLVVTGVDRRATLHPVELACLAAARDGVLTFERAHAAMRPWARGMRRRLRAAGLAVDDACIAPARAAMVVVTGAWLVVALERILHAIESPRPVAILALLTLLCVLQFMVLALRLGRPNPRGYRVLRALEQRLSEQRERAASRANRPTSLVAVDGRLLPMTLALMGPAVVLADPTFAGLDRAFGPEGMRLSNAQVVSIDGRGGSGNGGSDGGGGGSCGGGGCGGGCGG